MSNPPETPAVRIVPHGARYHLVRAGAVYAVPRAGDDEPLRGDWFPVDMVPADRTAEFTHREARLLLPHLTSRALGRPKKPTTTDDGALIDAVLEKHGITAIQLEGVTKINRAVISRARKPVESGGRPLTSADRAKLEQMLADPTS